MKTNKAGRTTNQIIGSLVRLNDRRLPTVGRYPMKIVRRFFSHSLSVDTIDIEEPLRHPANLSQSKLSASQATSFLSCLLSQSIRFCWTRKIFLVFEDNLDRFICWETIRINNGIQLEMTTYIKRFQCIDQFEQWTWDFCTNCSFSCFSLRWRIPMINVIMNNRWLTFDL